MDQPGVPQVQPRGPLSGRGPDLLLYFCQPDQCLHHVVKSTLRPIHAVLLASPQLGKEIPCGV